MPRSAFKILVPIAMSCLAQMPVHAQTQADDPGQRNASQQDISVSAKKSGDLVLIDVSLMVAATPKEAWDVLTDYEHMTRFLPNLRVSKVLSRSPTELRVAQQGGASHGPISLSFDVVRDVELKPYKEIVSHVISGDLKKVDGTTRLAAEGDGTRITFHSESIPNVWVPPGIGPAIIENETRGQFSDMRTEILRRKGGAH